MADSELLKRLFHTEIQPLLFRDNTFLAHTKNDDAFVNNNSVELPNSGTIPVVQVDRSTLPATIAKRTDVAHSYHLEELTTDPTLLQDSEGLTVAYNKRASILDQHGKEIMQKAASRALYKWVEDVLVANGNVLPTTGVARAASGPSQTGNRNAVTKADILTAKNVLDRQDTPLVGRHFIATPDMYNDLLAIDEFTRADAYGVSQIPNGAVGRLFGFTVWLRSRVVTTSATDVIKTEEAAAAATDQDAAVFWQADMVRSAMGSTKIYIDNDKPEYYGSIFSAMQRFGAKKTRNDDKGIVVLFEDTNP